MDRALDDIISERPRGPRKQDRRQDERPPPRGPRRDDFPRDGVRKVRSSRPPSTTYDPDLRPQTTLPPAYRDDDRSGYRQQNRRDERTNIETDWVHDRYEDEYDSRNRRASPDYDERRGPPRGDPRGDPRRERRYAEPGTKLKIENLHYELTKDDIEELFTRIGPVQTADLLYDRNDRSRGIAFVTFADARDADEAIRQFDGANAHGQPIRVSTAPSGPPRGGGSLFDRVEQPGRSLFDRVDHSGRRGGRARSFSPRRERRDDTERFPPRGDRSPRRGGGGLRERGRRPGARREESTRERKPRTDDQGRPMVGGRPRKTAEELDAEMADYFGGAEKNGSGDSTAEAPAAPAGGDDDIDMIS